MTPEDPNEIVRLATAANPVQAHVWQEALESEGIRCRVDGDYLDAGLGDIPGLRAEIWVERRDLERASAVLKVSDHPAPEEPEG
jgi:hypothetical protein